MLTEVSRLLLQAVLGLLEGTEGAWLKEMIGCVINVNVPAGPLHAIKGLHLAHQVGIALLLPGCVNSKASNMMRAGKAQEHACDVYSAALQGQQHDHYAPPLGGLHTYTLHLTGSRKGC